MQALSDKEMKNIYAGGTYTTSACPFCGKRYSAKYVWSLFNVNYNTIKVRCETKLKGHIATHL